MGEKGEKGAKCRSKKSVALLPQLHTEKKATPIGVALCLFLLTEFVQSLLNFFRRWWWRRSFSIACLAQFLEALRNFFWGRWWRRSFSIAYLAQFLESLLYLLGRWWCHSIPRCYHRWLLYGHLFSPYIDNCVENEGDGESRKNDEKYLYPLLTHDCVVF